MKNIHNYPFVRFTFVFCYSSMDVSFTQQVCIRRWPHLTMDLIMDLMMDLTMDLTTDFTMDLDLNQLENLQHLGGHHQHHLPSGTAHTHGMRHGGNPHPTGIAPSLGGYLHHLHHSGTAHTTGMKHFGSLQITGTILLLPQSLITHHILMIILLLLLQQSPITHHILTIMVVGMTIHMKVQQMMEVMIIMELKGQLMTIKKMEMDLKRKVMVMIMVIEIIMGMMMRLRDHHHQ